MEFKQPWSRKGASFRRQKDLEQAILASGKSHLAIHEVAKLAGVELPQAQQLAFRLARAGRLKRAARGLYEVVRPNAPPPGTTLGHLLHWHAQGEHCLSHASAMAAHGLGPPLPHPLLYVSGDIDLRQRELAPGVEVNFLRRSARHRLRFSELEVPGLGRLPVADPEWTLLEGLRQPGYCGGVLQVARFLGLRRKHWDAAGLAEEALRWGARPVVCRLGYLLELAGLGGPALERLERKAGTGPVWLDPTAQRQGARQPRWQVRLNLPLPELQAALQAG